MSKLAAMFGKTVLTNEELLKLVKEADWPSVVLLDPTDFFAVCMQAGALSAPQRDEAGTPFFYVGRTRVTVEPGKGMLSLREWRPPIIELAR